jgi:phosphate:Na+ symporter
MANQNRQFFHCQRWAFLTSSEFFSAMLTLFYIIGSLGLFLYGMKVMSEGLQKVSGEKLRSLVRSLTLTRFHGVLSGTFITTLVQSSSASTVMMVSFVNAGLLNLRQAIGMIMGANLGTTSTFWIIALVGFRFQFSHMALPAVGLGVIFLFQKPNKLREIGETLIGFGILFLGLNLLKDSVPDVSLHLELFESFKAMGQYGFLSVLLFFFFGIILTIAVQSSSVAGAITLTLVAKGWIDYELAAAIILGENVGTTITANIAALAANTEAKRAARAHFLFNIIGVCWMLPLFYVFLNFVSWITPLAGYGDASDIAVKLAVFHTSFNLINTALLIGFVPQLAAIATKMVGKGEQRQSFRFVRSGHGHNLPRTGEMLLAEAARGVSTMGELTHAMFKGFLEVYESPDQDRGSRIRELKDMEGDSDRMAEEITQCLILCASEEISQARTAEVTALMRVVSELEAVGDACYKLVRLAERKYRKNRILPPETQDAIASFGRQVDQFLTFQQQCFQKNVTAADMEKANDLEDLIDRSRKRLRREAVHRMADPANIKSEMLFIDIINTIERIGDHCLNILEMLRQRK